MIIERTFAPFTVLVALVCSPVAFADAPAITHEPVGCIVAGRFPRFEARFDPRDGVSRARVHFRPPGRGIWYSVNMASEGTVFAGILPRPTTKLKHIDYYVEVTGTDFATARTREHSPIVVPRPEACAPGAVVAGVAGGGAVVVVEAPAGAPAFPSGFASGGVSAAGAGVAAAAAAAGAGVSTAAVVAIVGVGAAAAGAAVALGSAGTETTTTTTTTLPDVNVAGRWVGNAANGGGWDYTNVRPCAGIDDVILEIQQSGNSISGVVRTFLRFVSGPPGTCGSMAPGDAFLPSTLCGTVSGNRVAIDLNCNPAPGTVPVRTTLTVTGNRMAGEAGGAYPFVVFRE